MKKRAYCGFALAICAATLPALGAPPQVPSRPPSAAVSSAASKSFGGIAYVSLPDLAREFGLELTQNPRTHSVVVSGPPRAAEFTPGSRECVINGLRVFLGHPTVGSGGQLYVSRLDWENCLRPLLCPRYHRPFPPTPITIAIDAGHGGADPGTENPRVKLSEKDATLDVARRLKSLLEHEGFKVLMTRTDDRLLAPKAGPEELAHRDELALLGHADLFVSIHFNAVTTKGQETQGVEVYTYPPANQHASEWWDSPPKTPSDLIADEQPINRWNYWNVVLAEALHRELLTGLKTSDRGKKLKHLGVLRGLDCPAVLIEPAVLTNDVEARRVATPAYRQEIASAIAAGIRRYAAELKSLRPPGSQP